MDDDLPPQVKDLERLSAKFTPQPGKQTYPLSDGICSGPKTWKERCCHQLVQHLLPHITRTNYTAMRDKSYVTRSPDLPVIEQNGWRLDKGVYVPVHNPALPAPRAVIELTKCGCKTGCARKCSCCNNGLPCTPLCKCYDKYCTNMTRDTHNSLDDEDDE